MLAPTAPSAKVLARRSWPAALNSVVFSSLTASDT
jgi:hypothetical protein